MTSHATHSNFVIPENRYWEPGTLSPHYQNEEESTSENLIRYSALHQVTMTI